LPGRLVYFISHRGTAIGAQIFILIPFRQNQEEPLPHGDSLFAFRTIKRGSLKLVETSTLHRSTKIRVHGLTLWDLSCIYNIYKSFL
jgi:hypothetical protein